MNKLIPPILQEGGRTILEDSLNKTTLITNKDRTSKILISPETITINRMVGATIEIITITTNKMEDPTITNLIRGPTINKTISKIIIGIRGIKTLETMEIIMVLEIKIIKETTTRGTKEAIIIIVIFRKTVFPITAMTLFQFLRTFLQVNHNSKVLVQISQTTIRTKTMEELHQDFNRTGREIIMTDQIIPTMGGYLLTEVLKLQYQVQMIWFLTNNQMKITIEWTIMEGEEATNKGINILAIIEEVFKAIITDSFQTITEEISITMGSLTIETIAETIKGVFKIVTTIKIAIKIEETIATSETNTNLSERR